MDKLILKKFNISVIIGTRPEAIKLAPVIIALNKNNNFNIRIILSGQHEEMVYEILELFNLKEDINLKVKRNNNSLENLSLNLLEVFDNEFEFNIPDLVILQGDTSTAFIAALSAFYKKIPIAHVEAGLRTNNLYDPFPEEVNRRLISQLATLHFAPTINSKSLLKSIGLIKNVYLTGNTVIDSLRIISKKAKPPVIDGLEYKKYSLILTSIHRRENWGKRLLNIIEGIKKVLIKNEKAAFIIPLHPNKIVRDPIINSLKDFDRVYLIEPLKYDSLIGLMKECRLILTDSGGLQEEAPSFNKPVLVLRNFTERIEAINAGIAKLVGTDSLKIEYEINLILNDQNKYNKMLSKSNIFGDGFASQIIVNTCEEFLNNKNQFFTNN